MRRGVPCTGCHPEVQGAGYLRGRRGRLCTQPFQRRGDHRDHSGCHRKGGISAGQGLYAGNGRRRLRVEEPQGQGLLQAAQGGYRVHLRRADRTLEEPCGKVPHYLHRGRSGRRGLGGLAADDPRAGRQGAAGGRRPVRDQHRASGKGHPAGCGQRYPDQAEPDRLCLRDLGSHQNGAQGRLQRHQLPPLRRDRGHHHCGLGGGAEHLPDQDRRAQPHRACGKVQPAAAH